MPPRNGTTPDIMLIIGQLLEATKAASEGLKSISSEVQGNARAVIAASKTLEMLQQKVHELDEVVRTVPNESLVYVTNDNVTAIRALRDGIADLEKQIEAVRTEVGKLGAFASTANTTGATIKTLIYVAGWLVTTGLAVLALFKGN